MDLRPYLLDWCCGSEHTRPVAHPFHRTDAEAPDRAHLDRAGLLGTPFRIGESEHLRPVPGLDFEGMGIRHVLAEVEVDRERVGV